jgi:DNA processing protein
MRPDPDLRDWLALTLLAGIGPRLGRLLLAAFGSPGGVLAASSSAIERASTRAIAAAVTTGPDAMRLRQALDWCAQPGNGVVTLSDPDYPRCLLEIHDPPLVLYVKGRRELLLEPAMAIVGSRNATPAGRSTARAFAQALSDARLCIVSGLALGIDAAAHEGGLAGRASTIAVTGTGLDIVYPARNRPLAHRIATEGLLVSEFPPGTSAAPHHFPRRNRLISGLSRGVLVAEAALQSGSLTTARCALDQGREVFAIPGSIHSPLSRGCHALIKQGAKLVETAADVLEELGLEQPGASAVVKITASEEDVVLAALGHDPAALDVLVARTALPVDALATRLLELELEGRVARLPGGRFQRT